VPHTPTEKHMITNIYIYIYIYIYGVIVLLKF